MRVWCIANQKGGVGKTTTAVGLAGALAASGRRILLVDLDPQTSLTRWFGIPPEPPPHGSHELFGDSPPPLADLVRTTGEENVALLAAQPEMAMLERLGAARPGLGSTLVRAFSATPDAFDIAVLDCPPALGLLLVAALAAADRVIVPMQTEPLALHAIAAMQRTVAMVARSRARALPMLIVPTLYDRRTRAAQETLTQLRALHGEAVWGEEVPVDTRLRDASGRGATPARHDPNSRGAVAYARLADWLVRDVPAAAPVHGPEGRPS